MKALFSQKPSYIAISLSLLVSVACKATDPTSVSLRLSKQEKNEIVKHPEVPYAYLGSELSDIIKIVKQISDLSDNNKTQGIHELRDHVNAGYKIGQCDEVVAVLTEALIALDGNVKSEEFAAQLKNNIERLQNSELNIEVANLNIDMQNDRTKENGEIDTQLHTQGIPVTTEKEKVTRDPASSPDMTKLNELAIYDKTKYKNNFVTLGNLSVVDDLVVGGNAELKGSIVDVARDLKIGCNILMNDTDSSIGNILKNGTCFIHNFGTNNTFVGKEAGNFTMTGPGKNTGLGVRVLSSNTTGNKNTATGFDALGNNTTGDFNTAVGHMALRDNTTGEFNAAIGNNTLQKNTTENHNTAIGSAALSDNKGSANTAAGSRTLYANTTGSRNTAVGQNALQKNTAENSNVAVGQDTLMNVEGSRNIGIGKDSGKSLTNGSRNIYIGSDSGAAAESNQIRIGTGQTDCFVQGIHDTTIDNANDLPVLVDSTGKLGTTSSSITHKNNIIDMDDISDDLMNLRPVQFTYKHDTNNDLHYGLIAEEVENVYPELVVHDKSGNTYSVRYHELPAMLLNELQKNRKIIKALQSNELKNQEINQELLARIIVLEELVRK